MSISRESCSIDVAENARAHVLSTLTLLTSRAFHSGGMLSLLLITADLNVRTEEKVEMQKSLDQFAHVRSIYCEFLILD